MLTPEDRIKSNPSIEQYKTYVKRKIDGIYYLVNYALFKKVPLITAKDSLCIKAVKLLDNGDCLELNISADHPNCPVQPTIDRIVTIQNPIYYKKTAEGLSVQSFNYIIPRTNVGMIFLKPLLNNIYQGTLKRILEIIKTEPLDLETIESQFNQH